jgi:hypothetical protein
MTNKTEMAFEIKLFILFHSFIPVLYLGQNKRIAPLLSSMDVIKDS